MNVVKVIVFQGVQNLPHYAAEHIGAYERRNVSVDLTYTVGSEEMRGGVADGTYDLAQGAVDNAVAMKEAGHDVVIFMGMDQSFNKIVVQPGIKSYEDLRGKTLGVDAPDTAFALIVYELLERKGIKRDAYKVKPIGATRFRLDALKNGDIDFAMLNLPFNIWAQRAGLAVLDDPIKAIGSYQSVGGWALRDMLAKKREPIVQYTAGHIEGLRWVLDPANKRAATDLLTARMDLADDVAVECIAQMLDPKLGFAVDAKLNESGMEVLLEMRASFTKTPVVPAARYVDESIYKAALATL